MRSLNVTLLTVPLPLVIVCLIGVETNFSADIHMFFFFFFPASLIRVGLFI